MRANVYYWCVEDGDWIKLFTAYCCSWPRTLHCQMLKGTHVQQSLLYTSADLKFLCRHAPLDSAFYNPCLSITLLLHHPRHIHHSMRGLFLFLRAMLKFLPCTPTMPIDLGKKPPEELINHDQLHHLSITATPTSHFNLANLNAQSISNKTLLLNDLTHQKYNGYILSLWDVATTRRMYSFKHAVSLWLDTFPNLDW